VAQTHVPQLTVDPNKFTMKQLLASSDPLHKVAALTVDAIVLQLITYVTPYLFLLPCKRMRVCSKENDLSDAPPASSWGDLESIFGIPVVETNWPKFYRGLFIRPTGALYVYEQSHLEDGWFSRPPNADCWHTFETEKVIHGLERIKKEVREQLANLYEKEDRHGGNLNRIALARHIMNLRDVYKL
jgi:hypothetical protein